MDAGKLAHLLALTVSVLKVYNLRLSTIMKCIESGENRMKKILICIVLIAFLTACSSKEQIIVREASSSVFDYESLVSQTEYFLKVKVLDEISTKNSYHNDEDDVVTEFYSKRKIEILDDFGVGIKLNEVYVSEAKVDGNIYQYSDNRSLKKEGIYLIYLMKSNLIDGYFIPIFEGAIVDLEAEFIASSPEVTLSDFISLLTADGLDSTLYEDAKYMPGIKEPNSAEKYNVSVDNKSIDYYVSPYGSENSLLEINGMQYSLEKMD